MKQIAIIDDDIYISSMLEELLVREGYGVLRAYSGTEALLLLEEKKPDLVLLDLMLPGLSGEEVLPHLAGIPVIVLSAKADVEDKVELLLGGAADYLTKPFDTRELLARIAVQLRRTVPAASPLLRCPECDGKGPGGPVDTDGVRGFEAPHAKSKAGGHKGTASGPYQRGYPRLRGEFLEGPCQQPAQEAPGGRGGRVHRIGVGHRL